MDDIVASVTSEAVIVDQLSDELFAHLREYYDMLETDRSVTKNSMRCILAVDTRALRRPFWMKLRVHDPEPTRPLEVHLVCEGALNKQPISLVLDHLLGDPYLFFGHDAPPVPTKNEPDTEEEWKQWRLWAHHRNPAVPLNKERLARYTPHELRMLIDAIKREKPSLQHLLDSKKRVVTES